MKRTLLILFALACFIFEASANHITGGQMYYTYKGRSGTDYLYHVTLNLYRDCNAPPGSAPLDPTAPIAIFDKATGTMVWNQGIARSNIVHLNLGSPSPCVSNPPVVCYDVGFYEFDIALPASTNGYYITYQRCCRIAGINNLIASSSVGVTYTAEIPGINLLPDGPENNSAQFIGADTVIVCAGNGFTYSFAAQDVDPNDQLTYSFCNAFTGGSAGAPAPDPPTAPPYSFVPYASPFNGSSPMGSGVTLDPTTGLISGIAPAAGIYVVTVCVTETRNGVAIAVQRKDLQIKVGDCDIAKAQLNPQYITCDGFTMNFSNLTTSTLINSYFWDFGVASATNDTSNIATPSFTYPDTGTYIIKLVTNRNQQCSDSTTAAVKVYPGFFPGFIFAGGCYTNPIHFIDTTKTNYGIVNSWSWNFGDISTLADSSHLQNPFWTYAAAGPKDIMFTVTNSKGCVKTINQTIDVIDKPIITLAFKDTLICIPDPVQLNATGTGVFSWTPLTNIVNANTGTPTVNPTNTTFYVVQLNDNGCINKDSVKVRVVDHVTLAMGNDTTICRTDNLQLGVVTDALQFLWSPAGTLNNPNIIHPIATPVLPVTTYHLVANIGTCTAPGDITVTTVPYPKADAGANATICYNTSTQLNGSIIGTSFTWTPPTYLNDPTILTPISTPPRTTDYILASFDTLGCPKPGRDTVTVKVLPRVRAFAGRDTTVVVGQPLQFNGTGGVGYEWSPPTGLNNPLIFNPIGIYAAEIDSVKYKLVVSDAAGCKDSAFVTVRVFKTTPSVFVPTAFTPNGDGLNDLVRPIAVGIQQIKYFSIYNRWGQLVFMTTVNGKGWDGKIAGTLQASGVFVWMVNAIDYTGKPIFLKGTVALIR